MVQLAETALSDKLDGKRTRTDDHGVCEGSGSVKSSKQIDVRDTRLAIFREDSVEMFQMQLFPSTAGMTRTMAELGPQIRSFTSPCIFEAP